MYVYNEFWLIPDTLSSTFPSLYALSQTLPGSFTDFQLCDSFTLTMATGETTGLELESGGVISGSQMSTTTPLSLNLPAVKSSVVRGRAPGSSPVSKPDCWLASGFKDPWRWLLTGQGFSRPMQVPAAPWIQDCYGYVWARRSHFTIFLVVLLQLFHSFHPSSTE